MRDLSTNIVKARVRDGDDIHVIFYRRPTNEEMIAYQASLFKKEGNKLVNKAGAVRVKFGSRIIEGFEKGTLGVDGKVFASDPEDQDFRADWKALLRDSAADIVSAVARQAFEGTAVIGEDLEMESLMELDDPENP